MKKIFSALSASALLLSNSPVLGADTMDMMDAKEETMMEVTVISAPVLTAEDGITRAEFAAVLVDALIPGTANLGCFDRLDANPVPPIEFIRVFADVITTDPYAMELCAGLRGGYLKGYPDGNFYPEKLVNNAEAAKMLTIAFALPAHLPTENEIWYAPYINAMREADAMGNVDPSGMFTMQEALDMIQHLKDLAGFEPAMIDDIYEEEIVEEEEMDMDADVEETEDVEKTEESEDVEETEESEDVEETDESEEDPTTGTGSVEATDETQI